MLAFQERRLHFWGHLHISYTTFHNDLFDDHVPSIDFQTNKKLKIAFFFYLILDRKSWFNLNFLCYKWMLFADYGLRIKRFPEQKRNKNLIVENVEKQRSAGDEDLMFKLQ